MTFQMKMLPICLVVIIVALFYIILAISSITRNDEITYKNDEIEDRNVEKVFNVVKDENIEVNSLSNGCKRKFSIVIASYNENILEQTVHSIMVNSSETLLGEILIIDDYSDNPVFNIWGLDKVRIIRTERRGGLIQARATGGDNAACDYIAIIDSHVKVTNGWLDEPYRLLSENYRTIVNPLVIGLNGSTFEFISAKISGTYNGGSFTWGLNFFWGGGIKGQYPMESAITVGEFFTSKKWWDEIGGMDYGMETWGGDNIDISLKTWLCGGHIVQAKDTIIGHRFGRPYSLPMGKDTLNKNLARIAEVWFGEKHIDKFYHTRGIKRGSIDIGDISKQLAIKERLNCQDMDWFIDKFIGIAPCEHEYKGCGGFTQYHYYDLPEEFR